MIEISINNAIGELAEKLKSIDKDALLRIIANEEIRMIRRRVHMDGKASDGSQIGTYSKGYMTLRTGGYKNKGKSNAGYYTKGNSAVYDIKSRKAAKYHSPRKITGSSMRPNYNWPNDPKVILALTSKMQQQMVVLKTDNGWGIGYTNVDDYNKAIWNEARYKKAIWNLTEEETNLILQESEKYINERLND